MWNLYTATYPLYYLIKLTYDAKLLTIIHVKQL